MSLVIQIVFGLLGFLLSIQGVLSILIGLLAFLALPIVPKVTGQFKALARLHLWLAGSLLQRAALVVTEHGGLLLKKMRFDDLGVEKMSFDDVEKDFEDPANALHHWLGIPFALADEKHGVLFDPRHAALGSRMRDAEQRDENTVLATNEEYDQYGVARWKRAVESFPRGVYELVTLGNARQLVDGGERSEYPERTETFYEHSRDPFDDGTSTARVLMIILALVAPFGLMWFAATQGSTGGGTTVNYALSAGWLALVGGSRLDDVDWKRAAIALATLLPLPVVFLGMVVFAGPLFTLFAVIGLTIGFFLLPLMTVFARLSTRLSETLGRQLFKLGLLAYDRPVLTWTNRKYELREGSQMETTDDVKWYGLMGSLIGFSFEPEPESWGTATATRDEIEAWQEHTADAMTDGGVPATDLPEKYVRAPTLRRASNYAGFVPARLRASNYYVRTGIAWGTFANSATGAKSMNRLTYAKDEHGGEQSMDEASLIKWVVGCGIISFFTGLGVFFL